MSMIYLLVAIFLHWHLARTANFLDVLKNVAHSILFVLSVMHHVTADVFVMSLQAIGLFMVLKSSNK